MTEPWASCKIRKIAACACAGNARNVSPRRRLQRKPLISDPGIHHGTCVTHVPWCMSGSLTCGGGENVPGIPGACAPAIWRIWQEAHVVDGLHSTKYTTTTTKSYFLVYISIWFHTHQRFDTTNVNSTNETSHPIKEWQGYSITIIYHDVPSGNQQLREPVLARLYLAI